MWLLRTKSKIAVSKLYVNNKCVCTLIMDFISLIFFFSGFQKRWIFGEFGCIIAQTIFETSRCCATVTILLLSTRLYYRTYYPSKQLILETSYNKCLILILCWVFSLLFSLPIGYVYNISSNEEYCLPNRFDRFQSIILIIFQSTITFYLPAILIIFHLSKVFIQINKLTKICKNHSQAISIPSYRSDDVLLYSKLKEPLSISSNSKTMSIQSQRIKLSHSLMSQYVIHILSWLLYISLRIYSFIDLNTHKTYWIYFNSLTNIYTIISSVVLLVTTNFFQKLSNGS